MYRKTASIVAAAMVFGAVSEAATIDSMTVETFGGYDQTFFPNAPFDSAFLLVPTPGTYFLSDGTSWESGAGGFRGLSVATAPEVAFVNGSYTFTFLPPADGIALDFIDFDSGEHSASGVFGVAGPLTIIAEAGGSTGRMTGTFEILSNDETHYGEPLFNYFTADVGDIVEFELDYILIDALFDEALFDRTFTYNVSGFVDLTGNAVPLPGAALLFVPVLLTAAAAHRSANRS